MGQEALDALRVLEIIQPGQKLTFKNGIEIVDNPSRIGRWLSGDNKETTIEGLTKIIDTAIALGVPISHNVVHALENLKMTYHKSKTMMVKLSELQKKIHDSSYTFMPRTYSMGPSHEGF
jgi:hypothetical protein